MTLPDQPQLKRPRRSLHLKVLVIFSLVLSSWGWVRLAQTVQYWAWLLTFGVFPGPLYLAVSGAAGGLAGMICALLLWLRHRFARKVLLITAGAAAVWFWLDRLLIAADRHAVNLPFIVGLTVLAGGYLWLALSSKRLKGDFVIPGEGTNHE